MVLLKDKYLNTLTQATKTLKAARIVKDLDLKWIRWLVIHTLINQSQYKYLSESGVKSAWLNGLAKRLASKPWIVIRL